MKNSVLAIPSHYHVVITTIVYTLLSPIFFELDNAVGEGEKFIVDNDQTMMYSSQRAIELENECKSPCPSNAEMCIQMCA